MELVIGGYAQGKTEYVMSQYPGIHPVDPEEVDGYDWRDSKRAAFLRFHLWMKEMAAKGENEEACKAALDRILDLAPDVVIVSDEIGSGLVPIRQEERIYRDLTGRLLIYLASRAEGVVRITCGLPMRIK